jgi:hypothetical protein
LSGRLSFFITVMLLLLAAAVRITDLHTLPIGLSDEEIVDVRLSEYARNGGISVFYDLGDEGREGLYHIATALMTTGTGNGPFSYRMISVWVSMVTLALIYATGRRLFGSVAGLAALALLAFSFSPVLLSRHIGRETLIPLQVTVVLLCLALALPVYRRRRRRGDTTTVAAALGLFLGLNLYIHPIGLVILLFSMVFMGYMIRARKHISRRRISYLGFAILIIIIISMPYMISSIRIPQLGGMERITGSAASDTPTSLVGSAGRAIEGLFLEGDSNPLNNLPGRPLFDPISILVMAGGLTGAIINWRQPRYALLLIALAIFSPVFLFALSAPNFINYAAALPLFALFFGVGFGKLIRFARGYQVPVAVAGLVVIVTFNIYALQQDLFERWQQSDEVYTAYNGRYAELADYVGSSAADLPTVICGWRLDQPEIGTENVQTDLSDAQKIQLMMNHHHGLNLRYVDCENALVLANGGAGQQIILPDENLLRDSHIRIADWLARGSYLNNEHYPSESVMLLDVENTLADRMGVFTVTTPVRYAPEAGGLRQEAFGPPVSFGNNLTFLGYVPESDPTYAPGSIVTLVTYWRIQAGQVPSDLRIFTHILADPSASPPANTDTINLDPRYLRNRDVFAQVTYVPLSESLPPGDYVVSIGAYQNTSEDRLTVLENGTTRGTRLFLYDITVNPN